MPRTPIQKKEIFRLQTRNWNKLSPREQDKALMFMYRVLGEMSASRKYGYDKDFWASYP